MGALFTVPDLPLFEADGGCPLQGFTARFEEVIKRSRFITFIAHADSRDAALALVAAARREYPGATHYCWAYAAGAPGDTARIGQSDDGEPHGTAGRPMLNQLLYGGMGEIAAVAIRYFGGIKLGTGGLTRAYQNGVKEALLLVRPVVKRIPVRGMAEVDYAMASRMPRLVSQAEGRIIEQDFGSSVLFTIEIPQENCELFRRVFSEATDGRGVLELP